MLINKNYAYIGDKWSRFIRIGNKVIKLYDGWGTIKLCESIIN